MEPLGAGHEITKNGIDVEIPRTRVDTDRHPSRLPFAVTALHRREKNRVGEKKEGAKKIMPRSAEAALKKKRKKKKKIGKKRKKLSREITWPL